jgi:hypothetical protein
VSRPAYRPASGQHRPACGPARFPPITPHAGPAGPAGRRGAVVPRAFTATLEKGRATEAVRKSCNLTGHKIAWHRGRPAQGMAATETAAGALVSVTSTRGSLEANSASSVTPKPTAAKATERYCPGRQMARHVPSYPAGRQPFRHGEPGQGKGCLGRESTSDAGALAFWGKSDVTH